MKRNFFIFFASFLLLFLSFNNAFADSSDPKQFIQEIVDEAKKILVDSNSDRYKSDKLTEIALATVDINGVGFNSIEKKKIAIDFTIPRLLKNIGMSKNNIIFPEHVIDYIIHKTEKEKGIRYLKRNLEHILLNINTFNQNL